MIKRVHHIGIAVNSLKESAALFEKVFGVKAHIEAVPCQKVTEAVFKIGGGAEIDLLEPLGADSAVIKSLEKRGEGLHHFALEVDDINGELKSSDSKGFQLIDKEGREGAAGMIGFLHPKSLNGVMVELVQPRK
ncbi:MAG TPA: methylmalonyl-CoA epimerase [Dehalococcoidales bacterium]|nr:methylmalonyl-CoA epimerase [Dehalococcoidales bacterium]